MLQRGRRELKLARDQTERLLQLDKAVHEGSKSPFPSPQRGLRNPPVRLASITSRARFSLSPTPTRPRITPPQAARSPREMQRQQRRAATLSPIQTESGGAGGHGGRVARGTLEGTKGDGVFATSMDVGGGDCSNESRRDGASASVDAPRTGGSGSGGGGGKGGNHSGKDNGGGLGGGFAALAATAAASQTAKIIAHRRRPRMEISCRSHGRARSCSTRHAA